MPRARAANWSVKYSLATTTPETGPLDEERIGTALRIKSPPVDSCSTTRASAALAAVRSADRLAERTAASAAEARVVEQLSTGGDLIRSAVPIRSSSNGPVSGVVVASEYLTDQFAARARGMTEAYEAYQQ